MGDRCFCNHECTVIFYPNITNMQKEANSKLGRREQMSMPLR